MERGEAPKSVCVCTFPCTATATGTHLSSIVTSLTVAVVGTGLFHTRSVGSERVLTDGQCRKLCSQAARPPHSLLPIIPKLMPHLADAG